VLVRSAGDPNRVKLERSNRRIGRIAGLSRVKAAAKSGCNKTSRGLFWTLKWAIGAVRCQSITFETSSVPYMRFPRLSGSLKVLYLPVNLDTLAHGIRRLIDCSAYCRP
ncbi:MAG TPA: hypothetical protein VHA06_21185, partial [Candidatus Angelobacter sp.]|nr:hypothetical protein [Candidatus Angelobacter sp.]